MTFPAISIGLIGPRGFGSFCTEAYHDEAAGRVVAFAGRDPAALAVAAQRCGVPSAYTDWCEMLRDPAIELVHIVTPPDKHAEMAVAALEAGKHVFVEKPLATSNADAEAILEAARKSGKIAGINFVMRYNPLYQDVQAIAKAGWLGRLTHVGFENYASDEGLNDDHWFWDPVASGGIFVEHGVHFFDIIGAIAAAPAREVAGRVWTRADGTGKEDRVQALVTYENGVEASYYHAFNRPGALEKQTAHFAFERGHLTLHGWIPTRLEMNAVVDEADLAGLESLLPIEKSADKDFRAARRMIRGGGQTYFVSHRVITQKVLGDSTAVYRAAVQAALSDLGATIRDPAHSLRVTAADGAESLRVALAARDSAREAGLAQRIRA